MPFAAGIFESDVIWILIPLTALMIPIIALLMGHQQKMARIIHGQVRDPQVDHEIQALRSELQQVHYQLSQQSMALEQLRGELGRPAPPIRDPGAGLQERVGS